jgi:hypothetical protein
MAEMSSFLGKKQNRLIGYHYYKNLFGGGPNGLLGLPP